MAQQPNSSDISLHLDQQTLQFNAVIEAIRDSYKDRLRAMETYRTFLEMIYTNYRVQTGIKNHPQAWAEDLKKARSVITNYLKGIEFGPSIDLIKGIPDEDALIQIKGIFDHWYVKEVESLQESLKEDLDKLIDRMKA